METNIQNYLHTGSVNSGNTMGIQETKVVLTVVVRNGVNVLFKSDNVALEASEATKTPSIDASYRIPENKI